MGFFDFFRRSPSDDIGRRVALVDLVFARVHDPRTGIRCEDALCAAATIVGERCIEAAGEYPLRDHSFVPGARVFSDRVNQLLCGDQPEVGPDQFPPTSVYGMLRASLSDAYLPQHFPTLSSVFSSFAAGVGDEKNWGKVPVTVVRDHHPWIVPLQFGFETRDAVDKIFRDVAGDKHHCVAIATQALGAALNQMSHAISPEIALRLAFEITNGMAKTAPMTKKAFAAARRKKGVMA